MKLKSSYLVKPHAHVSLKHLPTDEDGGIKSAEAAAPILVKHRDRLDKLQQVLNASQQNAILIVLQGMDTARQRWHHPAHLLRRQSRGV